MDGRVEVGVLVREGGDRWEGECGGGGGGEVGLRMLGGSRGVGGGVHQVSVSGV